MAPRETQRERLDLLDAIIPPILIEIEALRLLFGLLLDFDFHRHVATSIDPLVFEIQDALMDMLDEVDSGTDDVAERIRITAIASAMLIADRGEREEVDIEVDGESAANDD